MDESKRRGRPPKTTKSAYGFVRITAAAHARLVEMSNTTGLSLTHLASMIIENFGRK